MNSHDHIIPSLQKHFPVWTITILFAGCLVINFLITLGCGPIFFSDSIDYILAAKRLLNSSATGLKWPIEVPVGFPMVLAFLFKHSSDPFSWLMLIHALAGITTDILVVVIAYYIFKNPVAAIVCGIASALMIEKTYLSGSVLTEPLFTVAIVASIALYAVAWEKKSVVIYFVSFFFFLVSGLFRHTSMMLWFIPMILWLAFTLLNKKKESNTTADKSFNFSVGYRVLSFILINVVMVICIKIPSTANIAAKQNLSVLWVRTIQLSHIGQDTFRKEHNEFIRDFEAWTQSRVLPQPIMDNESFWVTTDNDPQAIEKRWRTLDERNITYWKAPCWFLMAEKGYTYEDASEWQGKIALDYLNRFYPIYIKEIFIDTGDRVLGRPIRAPYFSESRQKSNYEKTLQYSGSENSFINYRSKLGGIVLPFTKRVNIILNSLNNHRIIYAFNLLIIICAIVGFFLRYSIILSFLILIVIFTLLINMSIGGDLPRYRILVLPFSGIFIYNISEIIINPLRKK